MKTAIPSLIALSGVMFLRMLAVFITLPVIALYADGLSNASATLTGFALGAYGITQAAAQIGFGIFADKYGRKPALLVALMVFAIGGFWAAAAQGIGELIAARLLQGMGAAAAAIMAWLADISPPTMRGRAMAIAGAGVGLAFALSLFIAAPIAGHYGAARVFDIAAGLAVVAFIVVLLLPPPTRIPNHTPSPDGLPDGLPNQNHNPNPSPLSILKMPEILTIAAGAFTLHCALAVLFLLLPRQMLTTIPLADHWHIYAPAFILSLPPAYYLLRKADTNNNKPKTLPAPVLTIAAGLTIIAAAPPLQANAPIVWITGLWLFFTGFNAMEAILPAMASRIAPPHQRGIVMGAVLSCQFAGLFVGGAGGGMVSNIGDGIALAMAAVLILLWLVVICRHSKGG